MLVAENPSGWSHAAWQATRTDWFLITAQPGSCAVRVEHAGDRDSVAGISKTRLGSCRPLSYTVHARTRCDPRPAGV